MGRLAGWLGERLPLQRLSWQTLVEDKEVPRHRFSWAYYLGGLALFAFAIQLVTGLMLLFYYEPTVSDAHASIDHISHHVPGGFLVRNLHTWTASAMVLFVLLHLLTTFAMKAFDRPRELTWLTGIVLLLVTFGFGFTGYLLPWHQVAVNATKVVLQSIEEVGRYLPGSLAELPAQLAELIQGGPSVGQSTLSRFYALHVVVLPLVVLATLAVHLLVVQLHGMSPGVDRPTGRADRFFPFFVLEDLSLWGAVFLVLFALALLVPFEALYSYPLFAAYEPMGATPDGIKPEWYFYWIYYPLELLPFWLVTLAAGAALAVIVASPWIFRRTGRRTAAILAAGAGAYLLVMTALGQRIHELFRGGG